MGQIIGSAAKPKRCNLNKLSQLGILAAGEHVLVSYDNSMNAAGQGNFDRYIVGDGRTAATALELKYLDDSTRPYIVEEVNRAVADIQPIEITGDVTNAPDEEDLTSENQGGTDVLKFKDKAYNAALYSGLGRVYLRKNIVTLEGTGKNVLTQAMVNTANTIYHIQYDYDLNGQTITLPAGCVMEFDGGSLANGTINANYSNFTGCVLLKNCLINDFCGNITANNLCLSEGDDISKIIGSGWKNCKIDLLNIELIQHDDILFSQCDYVHILQWNINRVNSLSADNDSRDGENQSKLQFNEVKDARVENCTFDGTGSNANYVPTNVYYAFTGVSLFYCPNAIVRGNTIKNFPARSGIFLEYSPNAIIEDNIVKNVSIRVKSVLQSHHDTIGDGIYLRSSSTNAVVKNNSVEVENTIQIGRTGVCLEGQCTGVVEHNSVSGYDRAYHFEENNSGQIFVRGNQCTRCVAGVIVWRCLGSTIVVENNQFSNEGIDNTNELDYSYLGSSLGLIDLATNVNNDADLQIRNNIAHFYDNGYNMSVISGHAYYNGIIEGNKLYNHSSYLPNFVRLDNRTDSTGSKVILLNNYIEGNVYMAKLLQAKIVGNNIKCKTIMFITCDASIIEDTIGTDLILFENNQIELTSETTVQQPAGAIWNSVVCGIIKNNKFPFFVSGYSFFNKIAKGTVIVDNVFCRNHSYEGTRLWNASYVRDNLSVGNNMILDNIANTSSIVENKTT